MYNKKILFPSILFFFLSFTRLFACDQSTITITNMVDNGDGTYTYTLDLYFELGAADNVFYGFALVFNSPFGNPSVVPGSFDPTITNGDLSSGSLTGNLVGHTGGTINSTVGDSDWNAYMGLTNVLSYESDELFGEARTDRTLTLTVTIDGCAESIDFDSNVNGPSACIHNVSTGVSCAPACSITALAAGTQTACDPGTNTYTQEVTVTYSNAPGSGTLDVNGQSFAIGTSPQTVILTNLTANGGAVNVTAEFSADAACTLTNNSLFTAPASCSGSPCTPDNGTWD